MADREPTQTASPVWQRGEEHNTERLVMSRAFDDVVQQQGENHGSNISYW